MSKQDNKINDAYLDGLYKLPSEGEIESMSFKELIIKRSEHPNDSPQFVIFDNAINKHPESPNNHYFKLGVKQSLIAASVGGLISLVGTFLLNCL